MGIKKAIIAVIGLLYSLCITAQVKDSIIIQGTFKGNVSYAVANLIGYAPQEYTAGRASINDESVRISLPADAQKGVYRLYYSQVENNKFFDIIINGEKLIDFTLDVGDAKAELPVFKQSDENRLWYSYLKNSGTTIAKLNQLLQFAIHYPEKKDKIYTDVRKCLLAEEEILQKVHKKFISANSGTLAGTMVQNTPHRVPGTDGPELLKQYEMYEKFWDSIDTASEQLLYTPLYSDRILEYLMLYMRVAQRYNDQELENGFKQAVDTIMDRFGKKTKIKQFALDYLTQGFKQIGQETVLQYLDEKYRLGTQCENESDDIAFQKRMEAYRALKPGMPAPEVNLGGMTLKDIAGDKLVVAFWAGWCGHCKNEMPKLNNEIAKYPNVKIVAISLDEDSEVYQEASSALDNMIHFCDLKKWEGEAAEKFHIMATPTFFLLDKERKIIEKYASVESLIKDFQSHSEY